MPCYDGYIEIDRSTTSRSGLYASDLPGVEISMLQGLSKPHQTDYLELYDMIIQRAWTNLVSEVSIALKDKFFVDSKIISRETSQFQEGTNEGSDLAGITIHFELPKYARIHIVSIDVFALQDYASPGAEIKIYDTDEDGELLFETDEELNAGRNTVYIDSDFTTDTIFVAYDPTLVSLKKTENKYYPSTYYSYFDKLSCTYPMGLTAYSGTVTQENGGGLNVKYNVVCSIEKLICENMNIFKTAFWYRIGVELTDERILGNRLNRFTTLTPERAQELSGYFSAKFTGNVSESVKALNISEDPICFRCKNTVSAKRHLP